MDILLVGGGSRLMDGLINKFYREGHRVYVLTENRFKIKSNRNVFEYYCFAYDNSCIEDVMSSVNPDLIIALGAHDICYDIFGSRKETMRYLTGITNLFLVYSTLRKGRFIYISSEKVFSGFSSENLCEESATTPQDEGAIVLDQLERLCVNYNVKMGLDTIVARLDGLFDIPANHSEVKDTCSVICESILVNKSVKINPRDTFSLLHITDAIECVYQLAVCDSHEFPLYNISSSSDMDEKKAAEIINDAIGEGADIVDGPAINAKRVVLSNEKFAGEFGSRDFIDAGTGLTQMAAYMKSHRKLFGSGLKNVKKGILYYLTSLVKLFVPLAENTLFFIPFFLLNNIAVGSQYFAKMDFLLIYVIIFAVVHGQRQAVVSAVLATVGYVFRQSYDRTGFDVIVDYNTYVWMAQLFIVGLVIGHMRDHQRIIKAENKRDVNYLEEQLYDINDINASNIRVKNILINQLTNQEDSIGKIYRIVSSLDSHDEDEILFYAADVISKVMQSPDVAVYMVSDDNAAHLYSSTSNEARQLGPLLKYTEMEEFSRCIEDQVVYINRSFDERYPLMARAIYTDNKPRVIVMMWGIMWERMTLSHANMLTVVCYLIQNSVIKANKYLEAIKDKRYVYGNEIMEEETFRHLVRSYVNARSRGLTECIVVCFDIDERFMSLAVAILKSYLYSTDYIGLLFGKLSLIMTNANDEKATEIMMRFIESGIVCSMWKPNISRL